MAGSCDAYIRRLTTSTRVVNIPYKFWGLTIGETYRVVITPVGSSPDNLPYSFCAKLCKAGRSARVTIPKGVPFGEGTYIHIWIGQTEEYGKEGEAHGRGYTQAERQKYLEEQTDILRGCAGQQIHDQRVP